MRAAYDFTDEGEGLMQMKEGDIIVIVEKTEPEGWWKGYVEDIDPKEGKQSGKTGSFPWNYVAPLEPDPAADAQPEGGAAAAEGGEAAAGDAPDAAAGDGGGEAAAGAEGGSP